MERFDRKSWSDEEGFMVATQEYDTSQCSPSGEEVVVVGEGRADQDDVKEEFTMDTSWEELAATLMDCVEDDCARERSKEIESRAETLGGAMCQSKDDLNDAMVSGRKTVFLHEEDKDPSH